MNIKRYRYSTIIIMLNIIVISITDHQFRGVENVCVWGGGGRRGRTNLPFWDQILYISYVKCQGRDQCKKNLFEK